MDSYAQNQEFFNLHRSILIEDLDVSVETDPRNIHFTRGTQTQPFFTASRNIDYDFFYISTPEACEMLGLPEGIGLFASGRAIWNPNHDQYEELRISGHTWGWKHKLGHGIHLHFRPDTLKYYDIRNSIELRHGDPRLENMPLPYFHFHEKIIKPYFAELDLASLRKRLFDLTFRQRIQAIIGRNDGEISNLKARIADYQHEIGRANEQIVEMYRTNNRLRSVEPKQLIEDGEWKKLLEEAATIELSARGDSIFVTVDEFESEGIKLGPFRISLTLNTMRLRVELLNQENASHSGQPHPHVGLDGSVCWGDHTRLRDRLAEGLSPYEYLFQTVDLLKNGYFPEGAYHRLDAWSRPPTWYCDHCDLDHPNGENCPYWCSECNSYVDDMDEHEYCPDHGCYDVPYEYNHHECPGCEAEEEERIRQEEREAERQREEEEREAQESEESEEPEDVSDDETSGDESSVVDEPLPIEESDQIQTQTHQTPSSPTADITVSAGGSTGQTFTITYVSPSDT